MKERSSLVDVNEEPLEELPNTRGGAHIRLFRFEVAEKSSVSAKFFMVSLLHELAGAGTNTYAKHHWLITFKLRIRGNLTITLVRESRMRATT